ncbi:PD-(D/E)XK motif protein [Maridesulfovibrio sp. FT414]|uniref:PD-(D/E)XK motif protein n=1 Tax=Maridesulfovibrio sp. FT414 TaxID=2979469 RepID=UPI003D807D95
MNKSTPWTEIKTPICDYHVRQIPSQSPVPIFWGKDEAGRCLFILELDGDHSADFKANATLVKGLGIDLRGSKEDTKQRLIIALEKQVDTDLFHGLCNTLIASLNPMTSSEEALGVTLTHIKRWKAFFTGRRNKILTAEEVRGLFAELQFLRLLYENKYPQKSAIDAWCGPENSHQDFIYEDNAVEIKSLSGHERNSVRISSEDQLETQCANLYLVTFKLIAQDNENSISLNQLVKVIIDELTENEAIEIFSAKLAASGYVELIEYDSPCFQVVCIQPYKYAEGFPRLVRSTMPNGIIRVGYELKLESLVDFKCKIEHLL